jgi:hypothetical protein
VVSSRRRQEAPDNDWLDGRKATMSVDVWLWVILMVMVSVVIAQNIGLNERLKKLEAQLHR